MKTVILTTTIILSLLFAPTALAEEASISQDLQVTIPDVIEVSTSDLSDLVGEIPTGRSQSLPVQLKLRSNSEWFVKTSTLSSLQNQISSQGEVSGASNSSDAPQDIDLQLVQEGSWSDKDVKGEAVVVYSLSPGL